MEQASCLPEKRQKIPPVLQVTKRIDQSVRHILTHFFYSSIEVKLTMNILSWVLEVKSLFLTSEAVAESLVYERLRKHKYKHKPLLV